MTEPIHIALVDDDAAELALAGMSNKEINHLLDISHKTVEIHRAWLMERKDAISLAERVSHRDEDRGAAVGCLRNTLLG